MFNDKISACRFTMLFGLGIVLVVITWANVVFSDPGDSNIASLATATTSYVSPWETLSAVNDNSTPSHSNDKSSGPTAIGTIPIPLFGRA
jgi:hypothetical protein